MISQAMLDGDISPTEFHKVLLEVQKHCRLKADIRNQAKAKVKEITKEEILEKNSEKKYLNKEEKKAKNIFYEKSQILQVPRVSTPFKI